MTKPTLEKLPQEMVDAFMPYLRVNDVLNLHLSSRRMHQASATRCEELQQQKHTLRNAVCGNQQTSMSIAELKAEVAEDQHVAIWVETLFIHTFQRAGNLAGFLTLVKLDLPEMALCRLGGQRTVLPPSLQILRIRGRPGTTFNHRGIATTTVPLIEYLNNLVLNKTFACPNLRQIVIRKDASRNHLRSLDPIWNEPANLYISFVINCILAHVRLGGTMDR